MMLIVMLIMGAQGIHCRARLQLLGGHQTFRDGELFERLEPALIITRRRAVLLCRGSLCGEALAEVTPGIHSGLVEGHGAAESACFPGSREDQLAVLTRQRDL